MALISIVYLYKNTRYRGPTGPFVNAATPTLTAGVETEISITLITADSTGLACGSQTGLGNARCAFDQADKAQQPAPSADDTILPYMTVDNVLILAAGLWQQPPLLARLADEPPGKFTREHLSRFHVDCRFKPEKKVPTFRTRWAPDGAWTSHTDAWLGSVVSCKPIEFLYALGHALLSAFHVDKRLFREFSNRKN